VADTGVMWRDTSLHRGVHCQRGGYCLREITLGQSEQWSVLD